MTESDSISRNWATQPLIVPDREITARPESRLRTLPISDAAIALVLFAVSHVLQVGESYSLMRAAALLAVCSLIILYGYFRNPYTPLYCYAFMTPIFTALGTTFALILGGAVLVFINRKQCGWKWQFSSAGLAFCLWKIASLAWGRNFYLGEDGFLMQTLPALVFAVVISGITDPFFRRNIILMVILACTMGSVGSLRNWITGTPPEYGYGRIYALIPPDVFSAWLLLGIFGALAWILAGHLSRWVKAALVASLPLMLLGVGLCGYRAAILAVAVGIVVIGICRKRLLQGLAILAIAASAIALLSAVEPEMFSKVTSRFQTIGEDRGSGRFDIWEAGLQVFASSPITGVGVDNFRFAVIEYLGEDWAAHSVYIGTLVELGIVGCALLLLWQATLLVKAWQSQDRILVFTLMVVYLFQGIFLHEFQFGCFWLAIGLAEGSPRRLVVSPRPSIRTARKDRLAPRGRRFLRRPSSLVQTRNPLMPAG